MLNAGLIIKNKKGTRVVFISYLDKNLLSLKLKLQKKMAAEGKTLIPSGLLEEFPSPSSPPLN